MTARTTSAALGGIGRRPAGCLGAMLERDMPLTPEQRNELIGIQQAKIRYLKFQARAIEDVTKAGMPADPRVHHQVLDAATFLLERDERERDAKARSREVTATLIIAGVATLATVVQAVAAFR